jgi:hypothetical protein
MDEPKTFDPMHQVDFRLGTGNWLKSTKTSFALYSAPNLLLPQTLASVHSLELHERDS